MSFTDLISSSIGACCAEIITMPVCTIKTNYQTNLKYKSIIDVYKDIYQIRGIRGFYNSSISAVTSQMIATSTKFTFYSYIKTIRNTQSNDFKNNIINGMIGGVFASIFSHPLDVIKIHQQNDLVFIKELKKEGLKLLYRGYSKSFLKNIMATSLVFPLYDLYKTYVNYPFVAACMSSLTSTLILHPIDYLKVRHVSGKNLYLNSNNIFQSIKYYYRGLHINLLRVMPHFIITMIITEKIKNEFRK